MAIYREDIVDIELKSGNIHRSFAHHSIGSGDTNANRFGVRVFRNGEPEPLTGCSCQAVFRNAAGEKIALTAYGTVGENIAFVTLPPACYNVEGQFCLAIKLVGGGVTGTMRIVDGVVDNTGTVGTIAPTEAVPTYQEILDVYEEMQDLLDGAEDQLNKLDAGLSNAMTTSSRLTGRTINWVQGAIKTSDGSNNSSTTRIRTPGSGENYYQRGLINHLVAKPGYKFMVFLYSGTSYSSYLGVYNGYSVEAAGSWRKDLVLGFSTDLYFRIVLAADDDSAITTDEGENLLAYVSVDTSLTQYGVPADAKSVGDRLVDMGITRKKIRIMQYNIGDYVWGFDPSAKKLTAAQYPEKLAGYKRLFGDMLPDILCLQEFNQYFSVEGAAADAYPSQTLLFNPVFKEDTISADSGMTVAVFANEAISSHTNVWMHGFDDTVTTPGTTKTNNTRWKIVEFMIGGRTVAVCTGYLSASYSGWDNMASREAQLTEVFTTIAEAGYQYAIICADFNCSASTAYQGEFSEVIARYPANEGKTAGAATNYDAIVKLARGYGFTPANDTYWGVQNTYVNHNGSEPGDPSQMTDMKPLDNILIKGDIKFRNFQVLGDRYSALSSDHYPVIADLYIY